MAASTTRRLMPPRGENATRKHVRLQQRQQLHICIQRYITKQEIILKIIKQKPNVQFLNHPLSYRRATFRLKLYCRIESNP